MGADHLGSSETPVGRNNHDAYFWTYLPDGTLIAIVCDGCGGKLRREEIKIHDFKHSEVGSKIGVRVLGALIGAELLQSASADGTPPNFEVVLETVRVKAIEQIRLIALAMTAQDGRLTQTIRDYFLFTAVGAIITPSQTVIFSIGDGCYALNGKFASLGPFPGNIPPYMMYGLHGAVEYPLDSPLLRFQLHEQLSTEEVSSLMLGTDGVVDLSELSESKIPGQEKLVGPVSQFWEQESFQKTRVAITRRLTLLNGEVHSAASGGRVIVEPRLLRDDTTLIVVNRIQSEVPSTDKKGDAQ